MDVNGKNVLLNDFNTPFLQISPAVLSCCILRIEADCHKRHKNRYPVAGRIAERQRNICGITALR